MSKYKINRNMVCNGHIIRILKLMDSNSNSVPEETAVIASVIPELCAVRDGCFHSTICKAEAIQIIEFLCRINVVSIYIRGISDVSACT